MDEEGAPGQDETTLRPQSEQGHINQDTVFTAGEVLTNAGTTYSTSRFRSFRISFSLSPKPSLT